MTCAPVLVFDSGMGGLSVLGPIRAALPQSPIVYVADNAGFPYGSKSEAEIAARVPALLGRLTERYRPRLIVIACNTASTIALAHVRAALDVPVVGTVPAIKPAAEATQTKVIGVLGTPATVRQAYVDNLAAEFASDCVVLRHGTPDLAATAEAKLRGETVPAEDYAAVMAGLTDQPHGADMDTVVLACTHFPLVEEELAAAARRPMRFVHGGQGIARRVAHLLQGADWTGCEPTGLAVFTARDEKSAALAPALAARGLDSAYL
ncbi:glutamate racemase [Sphingosinicella soli]|uniref:Glutamate racemase n=1 Tax=Sphingosinicella soli TaxID=333708 RepID=A0A7W7AZQ9_9SPHN|nr:glutamate racemase [Sphingosinicella soli]MBB4631184.1 glutamate racemase [Sphingosinicella soli]